MQKTNFDSSILPQPVAAFSRATKLNIHGADFLFISGTASVGSSRETLHTGDFEKQALQTYENIGSLLAQAGMDFKDIINMTVYLKDIDACYDRFNKIRDEVFGAKGILANPPSSTCVQAKLCRPELLIEISAIAVKEPL